MQILALSKTKAQDGDTLTLMLNPEKPEYGRYRIKDGTLKVWAVSSMPDDDDIEVAVTKNDDGSFTLPAEVSGVSIRVEAVVIQKGVGIRKKLQQSRCQHDQCVS